MTKSGAAGTKSVTVIVPVYGDWPSLLQCISSLQQHLDTTRHKVLLVNDHGPEADYIGTMIKQAIAGHSAFSYHENQHNLGFLQNCNHAVFDLDSSDNDILLLNSDTRVTEGFLEEMLAVLYENPQNATVSPRSNSATICTLPFQVAFTVTRDIEAEIAYSQETFATVSDKLSRSTVAPVSPGFCLLIRRQVIAEHGLFDEVYGKGYGEENDFCLRLREHGYRSTIANRAFVAHYRSRSFTRETRDQLVAKNEKILDARYPVYRDMVADFIANMQPNDWFADVIAHRQRRRILINLLGHEQESSIWRAEARMYELQQAMADSDVDYVIACGDRAKQLLSGKYANTTFVDATSINRIFHYGYSPLGIGDDNQRKMLEISCHYNAGFTDMASGIVPHTTRKLFGDYTPKNIAAIATLFASA